MATETEPKSYNEKILACFHACCGRSSDGRASPTDVTMEMRKRGWMSPLDTVIDIADIMHELIPGARE